MYPLCKQYDEGMYRDNMQKSLCDGYSPLYKHIKLWDVVCLKQQ